MNPDEFERRLQRQPCRQLPREWRQDILSAAHRATRPGHVSRLTFHSFLSAFRAPLSAALWPSARAWAALAAVWVVIIAVNFSLRDRTDVAAAKAVRPSADVILALREQGKLMAELIGPTSPLEAVPPKTPLPQPRSERRHELLRA
jgi:hypothetical protein